MSSLASVSIKALQPVDWGWNGTILWAAKIPIAQQYWSRFVHSSHTLPQAYLCYEAQGPVKGRKSGNSGYALEIIARRTWSSKAQRVLARQRLPTWALASCWCWSDRRWGNVTERVKRIQTEFHVRRGRVVFRFFKFKSPDLLILWLPCTWKEQISKQWRRVPRPHPANNTAWKKSACDCEKEFIYYTIVYYCYTKLLFTVSYFCSVSSNW